MSWEGLYYLVFLPLAGGYIIGSIPFGLILGFLFGYGDIRKIGSGNIGTTNVLRTGNKGLALLTLILDSGKSAFPIMFFYGGPVWGGFDTEHYDASFPHYFALMFGLGAGIGHSFPIWLKFKGGKGFATTLGTLLAATPYAGLAAVTGWIITVAISRISSLGALVATIVAPIVTLFLYGSNPAFICFLITLLVWLRHKDNIRRLMKGEEPKIGAKK
ncbi:MAG: glycerol-3-phosphate 1-O-acyltransferase PlsY [Alphaproteobacteria bacterium]|nr:glycerol-3-phosphate 1-O-acyltransferase PlsY [Alphaproteobacteria bacterium]